MPQLAPEKFNVAWFKLAEFVSRKEKERALALYRLLVHSVLDAALILQLEGDLLLAFKDEKALELYKRAAILYEESGRFLEAAFVYEHILKISHPHLELLEKMIYLYGVLHYDVAKVRCAALLVLTFLKKEHYASQPFLQHHIGIVLDGYLIDPEQKKLTAFLGNLAVLDGDAFTYAQELLKT